jgi:uncharacterized protein YlxP (DUF503 family)
MIVGICELEVFIPQSRSLKDKRVIIKSFKDKISKRFNVSIAEVGYQDKWQRAIFGIAKVSNDSVSVDKVFDFIDKMIIEDGRMEVVNWNKKFV